MQEVAPKKYNLCSSGWNLLASWNEEISENELNVPVNTGLERRMFILMSLENEFHSLELIGINELANAFIQLLKRDNKRVSLLLE